MGYTLGPLAMIAGLARVLDAVNTPPEIGEHFIRSDLRGSGNIVDADWPANESDHIATARQPGVWKTADVNRKTIHRDTADQRA